MSTQEQNTAQQKDARPIWARLRTKAVAEEAQPQRYSKTDVLKQSNIWFRKQGVPLIIPARQRALDAFPPLRTLDPVGEYHARLLYLPTRYPHSRS